MFGVLSLCSLPMLFMLPWTGSVISLLGLNSFWCLQLSSCRRITCFVLKSRFMVPISMHSCSTRPSRRTYLPQCWLVRSITEIFFYLGSWTIIAAQFKDKTARQCRRRCIPFSSDRWVTLFGTIRFLTLFGCLFHSIFACLLLQMVQLFELRVQERRVVQGRGHAIVRGEFLMSSNLLIAA